LRKLLTLGIALLLLASTLSASVSYLAVPSEQELSYDDGGVDFGFVCGLNCVAAVKFSVHSQVQVLKLRYYIFGEIIRFRVHVLDSGFNSIYSKDVTPSLTSPHWFEVDVSDADIRVSGDFFVGLEWISTRSESGQTGPWLGVDTTPPHHKRSYLGRLGHPGSPKEGEDYMIRVIVKQPQQQPLELGSLIVFDLDYRGSGGWNNSDGYDTYYLVGAAGSTYRLYFAYKEISSGNSYIIRVYAEWDKDRPIASSTCGGAYSEVGHEWGGGRWGVGTYTLPTQPGTYRIRVVYNVGPPDKAPEPPTWDDYDYLLWEYDIKVILPIEVAFRGVVVDLDAACSCAAPTTPYPEYRRTCGDAPGDVWAIKVEETLQGESWLRVGDVVGVSCGGERAQLDCRVCLNDRVEVVGYFESSGGSVYLVEEEHYIKKIEIAENNPPVAYIDDISPNPAVRGELVTFKGHGEDPDGDKITGYEWRSSIDGFLSDEKSFSTDELSPGTHTIYFRVKDDRGKWSEWVSKSLVIEKRYTPRLDGFSFSNSEYTINFKGKCRKPSLHEMLNAIEPEIADLPAPLLKVFQKIVSSLYQYFHEFGHCEGMSLASKYLYEYPDKIPANKNTVSELTMDEAYEIIEYWQNKAMLDSNYWILGFKLYLHLISVKEETLKAKGIIDNGGLALLFLRDPSKYNIIEDPGYHMVLAYSYTETSDYITFFVYDPNFPQRSIEVKVDKNVWRISVPIYKNYDFELMGVYAHEDILRLSKNVIILSEKGHKLYLHVYDEEGRHVGINFEGRNVELEIPESSYLDLGNIQVIALPLNVTSYNIVVDAKYAKKDKEEYSITIINMKNGKIVDIATKEDTINRGGEREYYVSVSPSIILSPKDSESAGDIHIFATVVLVLLGVLCMIGSVLLFFRYRTRQISAVEIAEIEEKLKKLNELYANGEISEEAYLRLRKELGEKLGEGWKERLGIRI